MFWSYLLTFVISFSCTKVCHFTPASISETVLAQNIVGTKKVVSSDNVQVTQMLYVCVTEAVSNPVLCVSGIIKMRYITTCHLYTEFYARPDPSLYCCIFFLCKIEFRDRRNNY